MILLGVILLIIGFVAKVAILWTLGIILVLVGVVLWALGASGRTIGPRAHYW
jgi:cbb3-type cytochrome oxidase subunit 3